jgi:hypothetical protein
MGENFEVYIKKDALRNYFEKYGVSYSFLNVLFMRWYFNTRWHVLYDTFEAEIFNEKKVIPGKIIWAFITLRKFKRGYPPLVEFFTDLFDMFGEDSILVVSDYIEFSDPDYVSLSSIENKLVGFIFDSIKDYEALLR